MTDFTPLIQALQEATGPSRELDARIYCAVEGYDYVKAEKPFSGEDIRFSSIQHGGEWSTGFLPGMHCFTASLDAITALIERELPDGSWEISNTINGSDAAVWTDDTNEQTIASGFSGFPAIATCIAFLSAFQARGGANG